MEGTPESGVTPTVDEFTEREQNAELIGTATGAEVDSGNVMDDLQELYRRIA